MAYLLSNSGMNHKIQIVSILIICGYKAARRTNYVRYPTYQKFPFNFSQYLFFPAILQTEILGHVYGWAFGVIQEEEHDKLSGLIYNTKTFPYK